MMRAVFIAAFAFLIALPLLSEARTRRAAAMVFHRPAPAEGGEECTPGTNTMAVSVVAASANTGNVGTYNTPSFTPATNATLLAFVSVTDAATIASGEAVTNTGTTQLTWWLAGRTNFNTLASATEFVSVWVAQLPQGLAPFSMTVVCNPQNPATGANIEVVQVTGADQTAANGTNAIAQVKLFAADAAANPTNQFTAPGNNGFNSLIFAVADDVNAGTDNAATLSWTELWETNYNTAANGLAVYYSNAVPSSVTVVTNTATARDWGTILVEVKAGTNCIVPSYDLSDNFEDGSVGYEESWSEDTGTPDAMQSTSGLSLEGSQCLYITGEAENESASVGFTSSATAYAYFMLRIENACSAERVQNAFKLSSTTKAELTIVPGPMTWKVYGGSVGDLGGTPSVDTTYHCWPEYDGSGAQGVIRFYVSTTGTKPGSPDCEVTTGDVTGNVDRWYFGVWGAGGGDIYYDKFRLSRTTPLGDNGELP